MYCSTCGHANSDDALFCTKCGASLNASSATEPLTARDDDAWRAVIGSSNQAYYLGKFAKLRASGGAGFQASWHWPAFFVTWYWLLYRKMWGWAVLYFFLPAILLVVVGLVSGVVGDSKIAVGLILLSLLVLKVGAPIVANWLYYRHCLQLIESSDSHASRERQREHLVAKGGTSAIALILFGIVAVVAMLGIVAAIALPAYHDYTQRAKVAQILIEMKPVTQQVAEQYERNGRFPQGLDELPSHADTPRHVTRVAIDGQSGVIEIETHLAMGGAAGSIYLVPALDANKHLIWKCQAAANMKRVVPLSCRGEE